jgi:RNA polymerase sigma-70 factor (ECF subfamily)
MRLAALLLQHPLGETPATYALSALMCLNAARLPARLDSAGNLTALLLQDRSHWDRELAGEGLKLLELASTGTALSEYHVEAAIAAVHMKATSAADTDWTSIVSLYDMLLSLHPSPIVALNRAIALAERDGPRRGLEELRAIAHSDRLAKYPFYYAALGEYEFRSGGNDAAREHFQTALAFARNQMERQFFRQRMEACRLAGSEGTI